MPISKEKQKLYPGGSINSPEWKAIRAEIQERAENRCEWCKVRNGKEIQRSTCRLVYCYVEVIAHEIGNAAFCAKTGEILGLIFGYEWDRKTKIVCTVAHLNHDPGDNDPRNLRFLCQRCHLTYDAEHHAKNAAETRRSQNAVGDLFDA